jgi:hypothetical protein
MQQYNFWEKCFLFGPCRYIIYRMSMESVYLSLEMIKKLELVVGQGSSTLRSNVTGDCSLCVIVYEFRSLVVCVKWSRKSDYQTKHRL